MTKKHIVTDEQLGNFARRQNDLFERVKKGSVPIGYAMDGVQLISEKKLELPKSTIKILTANHHPQTAGGKITDPKNWRKFVGQQISKWEKFYKIHFDLDLDFSYIVIPSYPGEGWRLLMIANVSLEEICVRCEKLFNVRYFIDKSLDEFIYENERDVSNERTGAYSVWVKDVQEADENLKNLSANYIKEKFILTETLTERLIHELDYFTETKNHPDINNWTLCAGSRYANSDKVPCVGWALFADAMDIFQCNSKDANNDLRARQVISA